MLKNHSIYTKISLVAIIVGIFGGLVFFIAGYYGTQTALDREKDHINTVASNDFALIKEAESAMLITDIKHLESMSQLKEAFLTEDKERLYQIAEPIFREDKEHTGINLMYFIDLEGTIFLRVHEIDRAGDKITEGLFKKAEKTGDAAIGMSLGKNAFALRVLMPFHNNGKIIGYIELGEGIEYFTDSLSAKTGNQYAVVGRKEMINKEDWNNVISESGYSWDQFTGYVMLNKTVDMDIMKQCLETKDITIKDQPFIYKHFKQNSNSFFCSTFPIKDADGIIQGGLIARNNITELIRDNNRLALLIFLYTLLLIASFIVSLVIAIRKIIINPIEDANKTFKEIKKGHLNKNVKIYSMDEIGQMGIAFNEVKEKLRHYQSGEIKQRVIARTKRLENAIEKMEKTKKGLEKSIEKSNKENKIMISRELRLRQMKKELDDLKKRKC